jgi:small-conductance mechanosensitive channel
MDDIWRRIAELSASAARDIANLLDDPGVLIQAGLAVLLYVAARVIARRLEPRFEEHARRIKGQPAMLRVVVAVLRRTTWLVYVILLLLALAVMPGSEDGLLTAILALAATWLIAGIAARTIRNRLLARLVQWFAWTYVALVILGLDDEVAATLDRLALPLGSFRLSALLVIKAVLFLGTALWLAVAIGNFVEQRVARSSDLTPSFRVLIGKLAKIALVIAAGAVALTAVGVDLTALTVFSGAVGVGIGFGLQKVVSNFVSGVIILLDKSIKPGDTISLGETFGWIRDLRARFVSVVTRDGREYLIPNEDFITQQVINWSFSDELVRLDVEFGVSYDANPHQVSEIAINAAMSVGRVEVSRRPVCWMTAFGESSLDFVLRFWIHDPQQGLTNVRGKVLLALWDALTEAGIEIPFPQRDLHLKSGPALAVQRAPERDGRRAGSAAETATPNRG